MNKKVIDRNKIKLREEYKSLRNQFDLDIVESKSKIIVKKIIESNFYAEAKNIMVYIPHKKEVNIRNFIDIAWRENKKILVPKTDSIEKKMNPYVIKSWEDLKIGNYNIYEPKTYNKTPFLIDEIDVILVPGIIFAKDGYRIGYGGGFYDRFFSRINNIPIIVGVAYDFQVLDSIPFDKYDYSMNLIITEKQKIVCT